MDICPRVIASYFQGSYETKKCFLLDILDFVFCRKDTVLTIMILEMLSAALPNILIYLMKVRKYFSSNECVSLAWFIPFSMLRGYPSYGIVDAICESVWQKYHGGNNNRLLYMLSEAPLIIIMHLRKVGNHSSSNGCPSLQHIIPFPVLRGYLKSAILHEIWD